MNTNDFNDPNEARLAEKLNKQLQTLDDSVDELDRARLRAARMRAVEAARQGRKPLFATPWLASAAAAVMVLGITAVMWLGIERQQDPVQAQQIAAVEDLELLVDNTELEFLQELEFVAWLAEQPEA